MPAAPSMEYGIISVTEMAFEKCGTISKNLTKKNLNDVIDIANIIIHTQCMSVTSFRL